MKTVQRLNQHDAPGRRILLDFYPEHDSMLGHFADQWVVTVWDGRRGRRRTFQSFAPAAAHFNKLAGSTPASVPTTPHQSRRVNAERQKASHPQVDLHIDKLERPPPAHGSAIEGSPARANPQPIRAHHRAGRPGGRAMTRRDGGPSSTWSGCLRAGRGIIRGTFAPENLLVALLACGTLAQGGYGDAGLQGFWLTCFCAWILVRIERNTSRMAAHTAATSSPLSSSSKACNTNSFGLMSSGPVSTEGSPTPPR